MNYLAEKNLNILSCKSEVLDNAPLGDIITLVALPMQTVYDIHVNKALGKFNVRMQSTIPYHLGGVHKFAVYINILFDNNQSELVFEDFSNLMNFAVNERNKLISDNNGIHNPPLFMPALQEAELTSMFVKQLAYEL